LYTYVWGTRGYVQNYRRNTWSGRTFGRPNVGSKMMLKCVSKIFERGSICDVSGSLHFPGMGFGKTEKGRTSWSADELKAGEGLCLTY
jgi:hypothetical protein